MGVATESAWGGFSAATSITPASGNFTPNSANINLGSGLSIAGSTGAVDIRGLVAIAASFLVAGLVGTNVTFSIDRLEPDGVTWTTIWSSAAITANGTTNISIGPGCEVGKLTGRVIRARWVSTALTGGTAQFFYQGEPSYA